MFDLQSMGRLLVLMGVVIAVLGGLLLLLGKLPWLGRLPGDIHIEQEGFSCYFPIVTCIVLSILLTLLLNIIARLLR